MKQNPQTSQQHPNSSERHSAPGSTESLRRSSGQPDEQEYVNDTILR